MQQKASTVARATRVGWRALAVLAFAMSIGASSARAEFGLTDFEARARKADGTEETRAGVHPYDATVRFGFRTVTEGIRTFPDETVRDIVVDLPPGFVGDPTVLPECERLDLLQANCPPASQAGIVRVVFSTLGLPVTIVQPVFNMARTRGVVADFGFLISGVPIHVAIGLRSDGDYGVRATLRNVSQAAPFISTELTLWGVPADPSHDRQRCVLIDETALPTPECNDWDGTDGSAPHAAGVEPQPFLTNPTLCGPPLDTSIAVRSWETPDRWQRATSTTSTGPTECDALSFAPTLRARPDTLQAEAATGLTVDLDLPQNATVAGRGTPTLRRAVVTLPAGVSLNPSSADGLEGCTDAQVAIGTLNPIACPPGSKVGDVAITTPLLDQRLTGAVYLGQPIPGKRYRIFLTAGNDDYGITIRLEGVLSLDPVTGRVTAVFEDNPQLPFSNLHIAFKGGPRGVLAMPQTCGEAVTTSELTPWAAPDAGPATYLDRTVVSWDGNGGGCPPAGFSPNFRAGGTTPAAGAQTSFTLTFGRQDRERYLNDITVALPRGVLARIASLPLCPEALAAAGACAASSRIGGTTVGAGAGATPFHLGGDVYMTGPYKGAPFGLSIAVPAIAGPFDLGLVVVRAAVFVDRDTAALRVVSDPLPSILDGIPLRIRQVNVNVDRRDFLLNPTRCAPASVSATIGSIGGAAAQVASRFGIAGCAGLRFAPRMTLQVGARGKLTTGRRTPLAVVLTMPGGNANNKSVTVTLPRLLNSRLDVVNRSRACSIEQFTADRCDNPVGTGTAVTPLLRDPLRGPAYFVYNPARRLPDLVVRLKGQVDIDLVGKVTITRDLRLRTTFDTVPDAPITRFRLRLESGPRNGPIGVTSAARNLCLPRTRKALRARLRFVAQSNRSVAREQPMRVVGCRRARRSGGRGNSSVSSGAGRGASGRRAARSGSGRSRAQTNGRVLLTAR